MKNGPNPDDATATRPGDDAECVATIRWAVVIDQREVHEERQQRQVVDELDGEDDVLPAAAEHGEHPGEDRRRPLRDTPTRRLSLRTITAMPRWQAIVGIR